MSLLQNLLRFLGLQQEPPIRRNELDDEFHSVVMELAQQEQRSEQEIHADLLAAAIARRDSTQGLWERWQLLSPREQEVSALTCLGYTNQQIAARLGVSAETIKSHLHNILIKFNLHSKGELRMALAEWDFQEWENHPYM